MTQINVCIAYKQTLLQHFHVGSLRVGHCSATMTPILRCINTVTVTFKL